MSLVEVMIAMLILLVVALAVMQTALVGIDSNMKNNIRDEAVRLAEERMERARTNAVPGAPPPVTVTRRVRNASIQYEVATTVTQLGSGTDSIVVAVAWEWKGEPYTHTISSLR